MMHFVVAAGHYWLQPARLVLLIHAMKLSGLNCLGQTRLDYEIGVLERKPGACFGWQTLLAGVARFGNCSC